MIKEIVEGMIIEHYTSDYTRLEQYKIEAKSIHQQYNACTDRYEDMWIATQKNKTIYMFEDEIKEWYWEAGTNDTIAYDSWKIISYKW